MEKIFVINNDPCVQVAAVGDVALGLDIGTRIINEGTHYPFQHVKSLLSSADICFCNLEYPLTNTNIRHPVVKHTHRFAAPETAKALVHAGFNLVGIANNHIFDCLDDGLADTVDVLKRSGIGCVGAGSCLTAARAPAVRYVNGIRLGFLAYTYPLHQIATERIPGCAPNRLQFMLEDVKALKARVDHIIVSIHAGKEFHFYPNVMEQKLSRALLDEGVSAVLHHHAHVPRGIEVYKGKLIAYGLGNFITDINNPYFRLIKTGYKAIGMIVYLSFDQLDLRSYSIIPTRINENLFVEPIVGEEREIVLEFLYTISEPLKNSVALKNFELDRRISAKIKRLATKVKTFGAKSVIRELGFDLKLQIVKQLHDPIRTRLLNHRLEKRNNYNIWPNPPISSRNVF